MSWESIVRDMIEEENPDLHAELLDDDGYGRVRGQRR